MAADVLNIFNAAGGNRHPAAADWAADLVAFGAGRNLALWKPLNPQTSGIHALLSGHTDAINAVKFLPTSGGGGLVLLSGSVDKTIRAWVEDLQSPTGWTQHAVLSDHKSPINTIAVSDGSNLFVSGSADAELKIWQWALQDEGRRVVITMLQTITLAPKYFPLATALLPIPQSDSQILAVAGTKAIIQIFVLKGSGFDLVATLSGHEGWIRSLSFVQEPGSARGDILLASASQDKYIRLWRIHRGEELPAQSGASKDVALGSVAKSLSNKAHRFDAGNEKYSLTFEALLIGHEDWVFGVRWNKCMDTLKLLSASADSSLAVWEADAASGVWLSTTRLGEISSQKGATTATGSAGGYWIGLWSPDGNAVASLGRTGSWRLWTYHDKQDRWHQQVAVTGHTKEVRDLTWAKDGSYLLSTSADQTTRLFAPWKRGGLSSWHEFSRPQIHGYDLNCIDSIKHTQFISGADEKLLRVFDEPKAVAASLKRLCGIQTEDSDGMPAAANIPVLGLSNKKIEIAEDDALVEDSSSTQEALSNGVDKMTIEENSPPFEDLLSKQLLWPEAEKLYGHGYEIGAVAVSHDGSVVATACRASSLEHAVIRIYETTTWREVKPPLTAHTLTVHCMSFSADDRYLMSVGRDRQCAVFERDSANSSKYSTRASKAAAHSRMILSAAWGPLEQGYVFGTAGRDKLIKIWQLSEHGIESLASLPQKTSITAICFLPYLSSAMLIMAYGLDDGSIHLAHLESVDFNIVSNTSIHKVLLPSKTITSLAWRPEAVQPPMLDATGKAEVSESCELAVASEDFSVRIYKIKIC